MVDGVIIEKMVGVMSLERNDVLGRRRTENISSVYATRLYPPLGAMLHLDCLHWTDAGMLNRGIIFDVVGGNYRSVNRRLGSWLWSDLHTPNTGKLNFADP